MRTSLPPVAGAARERVEIGVGAREVIRARAEVEAEDQAFVGAHALARLAENFEPAAYARARAAFRRHPQLYRLYERLLEAQGLAPAVAAAASSGVHERDHELARLRLEVSERRPERSYLILELKPGARSPRLLELLPPLDLLDAPEFVGLMPVLLPEPVDGRAQLVIDSDGPLARAFSEPRTRLRLAS